MRESEEERFALADEIRIRESARLSYRWKWQVLNRFLPWRARLVRDWRTELARRYRDS